jgi:hypothetical protein
MPRIILTLAGSAAVYMLTLIGLQGAAQAHEYRYHEYHPHVTSYDVTHASALVSLAADAQPSAWPCASARRIVGEEPFCIDRRCAGGSRVERRG